MSGAGTFDNTHARTDERCRGGSNASAIAASDQPDWCRARARAFRGTPLNVPRYTHSPSGRRSFITLLYHYSVCSLIITTREKMNFSLLRLGRVAPTRTIQTLCTKRANKTLRYKILSALYKPEKLYLKVK